MKPAVFAGLLAAGAVFAQAPNYNLDFETVSRGRLRGWSFSGAGYEMVADESVASRGRYSMRLRQLGGAGTFASTAILLDPAAVAGKRVKVSGAVKVDSVSVNAALWLRADGVQPNLALLNVPVTGLRGTVDWARYEAELTVPAASRQIILGTFLSGTGTAWFDDLRVEVEGEPLPQGPAPLIGEPDEAQLSWLRENAIPFATERAESGFADLQPLKPLIGNARVVGLGEATHGTAEFFRMKHRLMEFLASEMGFTIFTIEANLPESYRMNDYVLTGRGDPREILRGMYFWTWNTQEVLDMVEWMRRFNQSGRGRVQFTGFDMQFPGVAQRIVREFVAKAEPAFLPELDATWERVAALRLPTALTAANRPAVEAAAVTAKAVRERLERGYAEWVKSMPMAEVEWAVQNARVVEQAVHMTLGGSLHRDEMMALNTDWVLQQNPGAKMVIWAHNYHVSRLPGAQGSYLTRWYGADYVVLGFAFAEGTYTAVNAGRLRSDNAAVPPFPGSAEYVFQRTGLPRFVIDLRRARPDNGGAWLLAGPEFREIGAVAVDGYAVRTTLARDYDALIWFDRTTASAPLPF